MANTKITDLATGSTVHSDDWLVCVDTHDTTMGATGTDKKVAPATVAAALAIAESQVTGLVADLALKAPIGSPTFSGTVTFPAGTVTLAEQANFAASSLQGNPTGSSAAPSAITLRPNLAFVGTTLGSRVPLAWVSAAGTAVANTVTLTSLFTGATIGGSLTIPANTLQVGSMLRFELFGTYSSLTPTLNVQVSLGGTVVMQGTTPAFATQTGFSWAFDHVTGPGILIQVIGASGKALGGDRFNCNGGGSCTLNASGVLNTATSQVTVNTTGALAIDIKVAWSVASASNTIQLLGGAIYLDY
jgi:hypothetical protein